METENKKRAIEVVSDIVDGLIKRVSGPNAMAWTRESYYDNSSPHANEKFITKLKDNNLDIEIMINWNNFEIKFRNQYIKEFINDSYLIKQTGPLTITPVNSMPYMAVDNVADKQFLEVLRRKIWVDLFSRLKQKQDENIYNHLNNLERNFFETVQNSII